VISRRQRLLPIAQDDESSEVRVPSYNNLSRHEVLTGPTSRGDNAPTHRMADFGATSISNPKHLPSLQCGMPNFDTFERVFKDVMSGAMSIQEGALRIWRLPDENKIAAVKNRSVEELVAFLGRALSQLLTHFPPGARFTSSDNNRSGKDLLEVKSNTQIELKSGEAMTDCNSGLKLVSWALSDDNGEISKVLKGGLDERRQLLLTGAPAPTIEASKSATMDRLSAIMNQLLSVGPSPPRLSHYLRCIAIGITTADQIKALFLATSSLKQPLMLQIDWAIGLKEYEKSFAPGEGIDVVRIERTPDRVIVEAVGAKSGRKATLYPNYKNSWKAPDGRRFEASNWVKAPCFQVWVD